MVDMLSDIFDRNKRLTDFLRENAPRDNLPEKFIDGMHSKGHISNKERVQMVREIQSMRNLIALYAEVAEYADETEYKWWGRGTWSTRREAAAEELIDILHFLMIAFDDLGIMPEEIYERYCEKNDTNWKRFKEKIGWQEPQR